MASPSRWPRTILDNGMVLIILAAVIPLGWLVENEKYVDSYYVDVIQKIGIAITLAVSLQLINGISGQFSLGHAGFMAVGAFLGGYATLEFSGVTNADDETIYFLKPFATAGFFVALMTCAAVCAGVVYGLYWLVRLSRRLLPSLGTWLPIVMAVWFVVDFSRAFERDHVPWYFVWTHAIHWLGELFTWLINLSQSVSPSLDGRVPASWKTPLALVVSLVGSGICAGAVGFIVGLPTLRLRGDYLAIATLGFAEIIRVIIYNTQALGGALGLQAPTYSEVTDDGVPIRAITPWIFAIAVLTTVAVLRLARSPKGRAIVAVREDEIAAAATGIDVTHHKVLAFVVGAFFAGVAGGLFTHRYGYINTGSFELVKSIELVVIVTIGGLGSIGGAIVAAIVLTWLPEFLRDPANWIALAARPWGVKSASDLNLPPELLKALAMVGEYRLVIYALLLIVVMILRSNKIQWRIRWPRKRTPTVLPPVAAV
jgi:ABC-type branched-subunit amino acid transport system permease subunit